MPSIPLVCFHSHCRWVFKGEFPIGSLSRDGCLFAPFAFFRVFRAPKPSLLRSFSSPISFDKPEHMCYNNLVKVLFSSSKGARRLPGARHLHPRPPNCPSLILINIFSSKIPSPRAPMRLVAYVPGCLCAWLPTCLVAYVPGCLRAWLPERPIA